MGTVGMEATRPLRAAARNAPRDWCAAQVANVSRTASMECGYAGERPKRDIMGCVGMGATRPQSCVGPTARRWTAEGLPAQTATASRRLGYAMEGGTVPTEVVANRVTRSTPCARRSAPIPSMTSSSAQTTNASMITKNATDRRTVMMAAMRPQRHAEPTARRWREDLPATVANASMTIKNAMDRRTVTMAAMRPQRHAGPTARMWMGEGSPAPTANASEENRNAMQPRIVMMGATTPLRFVETAARRWRPMNGIIEVPVHG